MRHHFIIFLGKLCLYWFCLGSLSAQQAKYIPIDQSKGSVDTLTLIRQRVVSQQSMVSRFNTLFKTLHGTEQRLTFTGTRHLEGFTYDSVNHILYGQLINRNVLAKDAHVFAWHPYWMQEEYKYYPYGLISTLCFFAYDLDPYTGDYNDPDAMDRWRTTAMVDSAKLHGIKVLLSVTSYGVERNIAFLDNKMAQSTLADSLRVLLRARSAQGVDLDFMDIPDAKRAQFTAFVRSLRSKLGDTCIISLHLPTNINIKPKPYDLSALSPLVNTFVVQGYEHEKEPRRKGAIAPLYAAQNGQTNIVAAVEHCLHQGLKSSQMIIGIPLYGTLWQDKEVRDLPYEDIVSIYEKNNTSVLQSWSESAYISLGSRDTIWYESAASLHQKSLWAKQHGLGLGLWGLGYDGGRKEVWEAVASTYAVSPVTLIHPTAIDQGIVYTIMSKLQQYRKQMGLGFLIILTFFISGILLSLLDWRVREIFFRGYITSVLLTALVIVIFAAFMYFFSSREFALEHIVLPFSIGALAGGSLLYSIMHWYVSYRKKMP